MKNTLLVFVILGLVLAGMLGVRYHQRRVIEKQEASEVSLAKMTFSFDPMKVTECSVTSPAEKVELKKRMGSGGLRTVLAVFWRMRRCSWIFWCH